MCFVIFFAFISIQDLGFEHRNRPFGKISIEQRADILLEKLFKTIVTIATRLEGLNRISTLTCYKVKFFTIKGCVHTILDSFCAGTKPSRTAMILFTHKNRAFGTISL